MIEFFRDVLNGPLYIVVVILSIIFIMAIIGFIMERKQLEKEKKASIAIVGNTVNTPIQPVSINEGVVNQPVNPTQISNIQPVQNNTVSQSIPVQNNTVSQPISVNPIDTNQV